MKKSEIRRALDSLKTLKMPKIEDKTFRNKLISDHLFLLGEQKRLEEKVKDLETAHLGAYEEERTKVADLQQKLQMESDPEKKKALTDEINSHTELYSAIVAYNKAVADLADEEVKLPASIRAEEFIEGMEGQDYDLGLVEAVFPMFEEAADR